MNKWYVYILECKDGSYYIGITNNIDKRMRAHTQGKGSKYVSNKGFKRLLFFKECANRSDACKSELHVKRLSRVRKIDWFGG